MKKIICLLLLLTSWAFAETLSLPGAFALSGELLYMKAAIDQPHYAITSSSRAIASGDRYPNRQSYHSGYRVDAFYRLPNKVTDIKVHWTHLPRFRDTDTVRGANLYGTFTLPLQPLAGASGTATLQDNFNIFMIDCLLGHTLIDSCPFRCAFVAGCQYGYARFLEKAIFVTTQIGVNPRFVEIKSRACGVGPQLGIDFSYNILQWLHVTGRCCGALLAADRRASYYDNGTVSGTARAATKVADVSGYWSIVPTSDLRLGLSLRGPLDFRRWFDCSPFVALGCLHLDFEVGYEVISFYKALNRITFVDDSSPGTSIDNLMDLTLHGPYLHLGISF